MKHRLLFTYSWYKSSSVIQQEHWFWYSFLPGSSSWGRLVVYIQTSNIRIRDISQNEKNFKSFLSSSQDMFVRKDLIDVREKFIIYLSCCCPPSFVSSLWRKLDDFMVGSKQQTPNLLEAGSFSRSKSGCRVEQELNVQRTRIFWIELLDAAANHRWQLTSRQKWCRVHLTFASTSPLSESAQISVYPRQDWIASLEYTEAAAAVQNACAYLYLLDHHHALRQKALWLQSTVGI